MAKNIKRENRPWWYELAWDATKPAIILVVHRDFVRDSRPFLSDNFLVLRFQEEFGLNGLFDSFNGDLKGVGDWRDSRNNFGFSNAFRRIQECDDKVLFSIDIPKIKQYTGQICYECGGTGKQEYDRICFICHGEGKGFVYNWRRAYAISASLTLFFGIAIIYEGETSATRPQLFTVDTNTAQEAHGGSLCGEFSDYLSRQIADHFVNGNSDIIRQEITEAMKIAYKQLFWSTDGSGYYDARLTEKGRFSVSCPGDACGLYSAEHSHDGSTGHRFGCHNVDNPGQQLTLLAGLAALSDFIRKNRISMW